MDILKKLMIVPALALCAIGWSQVDVNKTVVVVNGEEIKGAEYYHRMEYLGGVGKPMSSGVAEFPPGFLTIEQLITERLILQLAKNKGVAPTDPEVENELKVRIADDPKFLENWLNSGKTEAELRYMVRLQLAQFKAATAGVNVTDQEVEQHYKENPAMYTTLKHVKISVIAVRDADTQQKVDAELKAGKTFAEVAKTHSEDLTKGAGGLVGNISYAAIPEQVRTALDKIKIGQTTEWLTSSNAKLKFLLQDVTLPKKLELTPQLKRDIRKRLLMDKGSIRNNVAKEMFDLRLKSNIDIKDKVFAEAYVRFMDAYKKDAALKGAGG